AFCGLFGYLAVPGVVQPSGSLAVEILYYLMIVGMMGLGVAIILTGIVALVARSGPQLVIHAEGIAHEDWWLGGFRIRWDDISKCEVEANSFGSKLTFDLTDSLRRFRIRGGKVSFVLPLGLQDWLTVHIPKRHVRADRLPEVLR